MNAPPEARPPGNPLLRFFGAAVAAIGVLITALCGLCTLGFLGLSATQGGIAGLAGIVMLALLFGAIPILIGVAMIFGGLAMRRAGR